MIFRRIKGLKLPGHREMSMKGPIIKLTNHEYVYIPLSNGNEQFKCLVEVGQTVLKGQPVAIREGRFTHPLHSSVSGTVTSIEKIWHCSGKVMESIEIKNDFKDQWVDTLGQNLALAEFNKEEWVNRIKECGIVGLGGAGFPTWVKYLTNAEINMIVVNGVECEPFLTCDDYLMKNSVEKLIRGIKYAMRIAGAVTAKIAVKGYKKELISVLKDALESYPEITVLPLRNVYPAGWERFIVEAATKRKYNVLPSELGVIVNNAQTLIAITEAIEENKPLVERLVTVTGEGVASPCNVWAPIGVLVSDLINAAGGYVIDNPNLVVGGPMTGRSLFSSKTYTLPQTGSILVLARTDETEEPCMGCGKCALNCPAFLTPTQIKSALENNDYQELEKLNTTRCCQCGLCSYVCPSRVNMTESVGKAIDLVYKNRRNNSKKG